MKSLYFEAHTIGPKSEEMLAKIKHISKRRTQVFLPERSALLVLDMQNYFLRPNSHAFIPSSVAILPGIQSLISSYHRQSLPIYFTRHINTRENAGMMAKWWRDLIDVDSPLSEITSEFDIKGAMTIEKSHYDAFYITNLENCLRQAGVEQVVICGVMTHLCCETTARSAFMHGFEVFFTVDGTATYNEEFHQATLMNLAHGFAMPVLVKEILSELG